MFEKFIKFFEDAIQLKDIGAMPAGLWEAAFFLNWSGVGWGVKAGKGRKKIRKKFTLRLERKGGGLEP